MSSLRAMAWFRIGTLGFRMGVKGIGPYVQWRMLRLYGLDMIPGNLIGGGLYIPHTVGCTIVVERMGENVTVIGASTFGMRETLEWPIVGDSVFVGVGSRVLGGITLGDNAKIGAGSVVLIDVPAGATAVGIPARII